MLRTRDLAFGALLIALSLAIPLAFGGVLTVAIPPFTATVASHVPLFLSMLISPAVAVMVGLGSAIGFTLRLTPVIGARAAMHMVVGYAGARLVRSGRPYWLALLLVLPLHAILEALIVIPFGFSLYRAGVVVGVGTALHHLVDTSISVALARILVQVNVLPEAYRPKFN
ncbi:MAG: ECF transporter S component [Bacillota bacterium]